MRARWAALHGSARAGGACEQSWGGNGAPVSRSPAARRASPVQRRCELASAAHGGVPTDGWVDALVSATNVGGASYADLVAILFDQRITWRESDRGTDGAGLVHARVGRPEAGPEGDNGRRIAVTEGLRRSRRALSLVDRVDSPRRYCEGGGWVSCPLPVLRKDSRPPKDDSSRHAVNAGRTAVRKTSR